MEKKSAQEGGHGGESGGDRNEHPEEENTRGVDLGRGVFVRSDGRGSSEFGGYHTNERTCAGSAPSATGENENLATRETFCIVAVGNVKANQKVSKAKAPWRCPKCGREFARRSAYHSCGNYTLEGYLEKKNPQAVALFNQLLETAKSLGPITISVGKTQVSFRMRTTFMMVDVTGRKLCGYLFLHAAHPAPFFRKVKAVSANRYVHIFHIDDPEMIRGEFGKLVAEAIAENSETDEGDVKPEKEARIGEQINSIYRDLRSEAAIESARVGDAFSAPADQSNQFSSRNFGT
jgi:hypothetical protein